MSIFKNINIFRKKMPFKPLTVEFLNTNQVFKIYHDGCEIFFDKHQQTEDGVIELTRGEELVGRLVEQKKVEFDVAMLRLSYRRAYG